MRRLLVLAAAALCALPAAALADGLPLVDYGTRPGAIETERGRIVAIPAGRDTVVAELAGSDYVRNSRMFDGRLAVPAVAYDGTPGGLSLDGRRLALIEPRVGFPRKRTRFVIVDKDLRVRKHVDLRGDFSFDAISPDGSALFLVEYTNRRDPSEYQVRVYDVEDGRLEGEPLIDSETAAIVMRGLPQTRATRGPVEYTLYDGLGKPFVHALDTAQRSALCIPLPRQTRAVAPFRLKLNFEGRTLAVSDARSESTLARVDTQTNRVLPYGAWFEALLRGSPGSARAPRV